MNAEKGRVPNIVYGYDKTIGDYFNLAINEEEAAVVRQIYEWYIKDGYGAAKISIFLNERGLRTKRNCQWSQNGVCRILTNELYTGKIINGKQEVTDFLTGQRADKDETEWMVVERPDLRIIEPEVLNRHSRLCSPEAKHLRWIRNAKAINICSLLLSNARNAAGPSGAQSAHIKTLMSAGCVPGITGVVQTTAPML